MTPDIQWSGLVTEIGLIALALSCVVLDICRRKITWVAIAGVGLILFVALLWPGGTSSSFGGSFVQDGLSRFFKILFLLAGLFTLFMARSYEKKLKRGHDEFVLLVLFSLIGMSFLASANDFLLLFVALETLTVSLYIMTAYLRDKTTSIEAGVKFLVLGALATAFFVYGLSFVYGSCGSTGFADIQKALPAKSGSVLPSAFLFGMVLIVAALGFKISAVPFHAWAPDVYEGAPTPVTAFLAIGSKTAGFAAILRLLLTAFSPAEAPLMTLFGVLACVTIFFGNLGALRQTNLKRLLGYSSIGHAGYLLIGFAAFWHTGKEAVLYYLASYIFSTAGAFLVLVAVTQHTKTDETSELAGLSERSPLLAAGMFLSLCSLAGVPPLAGFFAKFYLLKAAISADLLWLAAVGALNVITSLYYYLKVVKVIYVDPAADGSKITLKIEQVLLQYASIAGILFLGIYPEPVLRLAEAALAGFIR